MFINNKCNDTPIDRDDCLETPGCWLSVARKLAPVTPSIASHRDQ